MDVPEDLAWVSDEAVAQLLASEWANEWPSLLVACLDERWPDWTNADDDERREWLDLRVAALPLGWLTDAQRAQLDQVATTRGAVHEWLPAQLDEWWPEWTTASPDQLVSWFEEWLPTLQPFDARTLTWVSEDQVTQLNRLDGTRGPWQQWLPSQLDEWWPGWDQSESGALANWLHEALPALLAETPTTDIAADEELTAFDARALTWLSEDQVTQLDRLEGTRGRWQEWLPPQLDEWWPGWDQSESGALANWLHEALPALLAEPPKTDIAADEELAETPTPDEVPPQTQQLIETAVKTELVPMLTALAAETPELINGLAPEEIAQVLQSITAEDLANAAPES